MRGSDQPQTALFSYVSVEDRNPADRPLRANQALVNPILATLSPRFQALYSTMGRLSIPPERLLRAMLLQKLNTIRSERQLMEQLDYNSPGDSEGCRHARTVVARTLHGRWDAVGGVGEPEEFSAQG